MHAFLKGAKTNASSASTSKEKSVPQTKKQAPIPWVEKYRPKVIDDVAYQDEVVAVLKKCLQGADLPNLLFYGPPGTGKTSTILAAAKQLFGDMYKNRILELNASDERGIQVIREKVKTFSQLTASGVQPDGKSCPPFKIVILDEADAMTTSAQVRINRIRNMPCRIIEPLTSRCSKFRFKPLAHDILIQRLKEICEKEGVKCEDEAFEALVKTSEGDLRKAITSLQSTHRLKGEAGIKTVDVYDITGVIEDKWINDLISTCHTNSFEKLEKFVTDLMLEGHSAYQLLSQIHDRVLTQTNYTDKQKSVIFEKLAICDHRLLEGADEYIQVMDLCTTIMETICQKK